MILKRFIFLLICFLALQGPLLIVQAELEGFDEPAVSSSEAKEGKDKSSKIAFNAPPSFKARAVKRSSPSAPPSSSSHETTTLPNTPKQKVGYGFEIFSILFLSTFGIFAYVGTQKNLKIVNSWCKYFCEKDCLFDRNFSLVGTSADETIKKENSCQFKFYASGRRYCQGLLATINLRGRSNLFSYLFETIFPTEDIIEIDVFMNPENSPPVILALATPKIASKLLSDANDIKTYTRKLMVTASNSAFSQWNNKKMVVLAENSAIFYEVFSDQKLVQFFTNFSDAHAPTLRYFRSLHISDDFAIGSHQYIIRFRFALPSRAEDMILIEPLMELIPKFIDLIGTFRPSADVRKKILDSRTKQTVPKDSNDDAIKARNEAAKQRKMDKIQEEKEKIAKMSPEVRQKYEDKMQAKAMKKNMKMRKA
uniref:Coiled-coil domain-containing protein 47 n=1 Tax=Polytomella parva TaxID=51329 RepID=A0A7S0VAS8_9CHLO|mmetsp:Transcript_34085/g.61442  ORF Transcript_34085/g.61442 Transcript_34085/m.61442 type:complete len:423 (+) Transcript_34085:59-1327(+)|eukprot:CAMPEP_0175054574 /NCGR_PEP_ID=MMETSP0052_2-20121109/9579_1 /TAXON_ID=51329 ORGANISM="Polytomella parva, Strain SAG 63-3" /NCGR_SAMPLE_ID=MMETSP0052_2 /ASSEMBLY_ACC=CAM_ASM_000194 /LENGTH=422 /DNA_ID=CAMNT_0016319281 /DNA_START=46 /DNA_END=1314 /DNA_ORIENTATION=+